MGSVKKLSDEKIFKKFLVQRSILDTFRVYLDITDAFLDQMESADLLSDDQLIVLRVSGQLIQLTYSGESSSIRVLRIRYRVDPYISVNFNCLT